MCDCPRPLRLAAPRRSLSGVRGARRRTRDIGPIGIDAHRATIAKLGLLGQIWLKWGLLGQVWGIWGQYVTVFIVVRRRWMATVRAVAAGAATAILLTGCTASPSSDAARSSVPLPSPTGTWAPAAVDEGEGPRTPAPLPTESAALDQPIEFETGIAVSLTSVASTTVTASTPGEVSGEAVVVKLSVTNNSTAPIDLASAVVNLSAADGAYGVGTTAGDPRPLVGELAPDASSSGIYVFMLAPARGREVIISVNYGAGEPLAVFTGETS